MPIQTRISTMEVKHIIADMMKEAKNVSVRSLYISIKLIETRGEFYTNIISEFRTNNLKVLENMIMGFEKLAVAIDNICVSSSQTKQDLLNKMDTLTSCINNTN